MAQTVLNVEQVVSAVKAFNEQEHQQFLAALVDIDELGEYMKAPAIDEASQKVTRVNFAKQILRELQRLEQNCGEPVAAVYVDSLFSTMRTMRDLFPTDSFVEVLMALYNAMAADNNWCDLQAHQINSAASILQDIFSKEKTSILDVEDAILSLEKVGFDTTPFGGVC